MSSTIATPSAAERDASPEADAGDAWARERLERQLRWLDRLAEAGGEIALAVEADIRRPETAQGEAAQGKAACGDAARAYARVSRAVLLQSRLVKDFDARETAARQARAEAEALADKARQERTELRKCHVSWIVDRVARGRHEDAETVERLTREADERLDDDGLLGDVLSRPISETVALICRDLGLDPDWTRLVEEAWAQEELASGAVGWPLMATPSLARPPPLAAGEAIMEVDWPDGRAAVAKAFRGDTS